MYKDENDYELLYLVSENNEDANEIFYKKYKPIIEQKATKLFPIVKNKGYDLSDLVQEGMIGLSEALNSYKEQKNVTFATFASVCIDRQLSTFVRNVNRQKHKVLNDSVSMDTAYNSRGVPLMSALFDKNNVNPEEDYISSEKEEELMKKIYKDLNEKQREVFDLKVEGFTIQEICKLLNVSRKSIDSTLARIKIKIKNIIDNEEK